MMNMALIPLSKIVTSSDLREYRVFEFPKDAQLDIPVRFILMSSSKDVSYALVRHDVHPHLYLAISMNSILTPNGTTGAGIISNTNSVVSEVEGHSLWTDKNGILEPYEP